jgi:DNA-binding response OmpR family regulator
MAAYRAHMKILLVEDEAALADVIARNLRARGNDITIAGTAEAALLEMASSWPDVLILDVNLPDLTGWDILRRLTAADRARVGVVVISAAPLSQKRIEEFQPLKWLQKPFPMDALIRLIAEVEPASPNDR